MFTIPKGNFPPMVLKQKRSFLKLDCGQRGHVSPVLRLVDGVVVVDGRFLLDDLALGARTRHGRAQKDVDEKHYEEQDSESDGQPRQPVLVVRAQPDAGAIDGGSAVRGPGLRDENGGGGRHGVILGPFERVLAVLPVPEVHQLSLDLQPGPIFIGAFRLRTFTAANGNVALEISPVGMWKPEHGVDRSLGCSGGLVVSELRNEAVVFATSGVYQLDRRVRLVEGEAPPHQDVKFGCNTVR